MVTQYLAYVYEIVDRDVKVYSDVIPRSNNLVKPLQDGLTKTEVPAVDDLVLVLDMDSSHAIRFYTPVRKAFAILTDDPVNTQIESTGKVQIAATDLIELGTESLEGAVKGEVLKQQMTDILTEIMAHTHIGNIGLATSPPLDAAAFSAFISLLTQYISLKVKVQ